MVRTELDLLLMRRIEPVLDLKWSILCVINVFYSSWRSLKETEVIGFLSLIFFFFSVMFCTSPSEKESIFLLILSITSLGIFKSSMLSFYPMSGNDKSNQDQNEEDTGWPTLVETITIAGSWQIFQFSTKIPATELKVHIRHKYLILKRRSLLLIKKWTKVLSCQLSHWLSNEAKFSLAPIALTFKTVVGDELVAEFAVV